MNGIEDLLKSLGGDESMKKQANQLWKMLDDMADSDPDGYKKFIDTNMKKGMEVMKKEKEQKKAPLMRQISSKKFGIQLQYWLELSEHDLSDSDISDQHKKFLVPEGEPEKEKNLKEEILKEGKLFINLFFHKE